MRPADLAIEPNERGDFADADCEACPAKLCGLLRSGTAPRRRVIGRGERLKGTGCFTLWTVLDGLVALCTTLPDGRRQIVSLSPAGEVACPVATDSAEIWIEALAASKLCELDFGAGAQSRLGQDATLGAELFRMTHNQVKCLSAHLVTLGRLDGMERVCYFLSDMAWRVGRETAGGWHVRLPLSREDIADYLGLNPETVSRIFGRVKKARLATFLSPTEYLVPDIAALQDRAPLAPPTAASNRLEDTGRGLRVI